MNEEIRARGAYLKINFSRGAYLAGPIN